MTDREAILARIRALAAKTVENGCTEAEAVAATEMVAKLLARYNLTLDEATLRASPFQRHTAAHADAAGKRLWIPACAISELTGARWWTSAAGMHPVTIDFFGFDHEVAVAAYLLEICARAMRGREAAMEADLWRLRRAAQQLRIWPVLDGMADRLAERIRAMIPPTPTGTGLVVLRGQLIDQGLADIGIHLTDLKATASRRNEAGYAAGRRAADQVALNPGLGGTAASARLRGG